MVSDLVGQNARPLLDSPMGKPGHLTVDYPTYSLYWLDSEFHGIYRCKLHSPNPQKEVLLTYFLYG
jgi:hypothetical protein